MSHDAEAAQAETATPEFIDSASQRNKAKQKHTGRREMDDDFMQQFYKVKMCTRTTPHNWKLCPWAHPGETAANRRHPSCHTAELCPAVRQHQECPHGDSCMYARNTFEYWLHPSKYRTMMCSAGELCMRNICFFAHNKNELRRPADGRKDRTTSEVALQEASQQSLLHGMQGRQQLHACSPGASTTTAAHGAGLAPHPALHTPASAGACSDLGRAVGLLHRDTSIPLPFSQSPEVQHQSIQQQQYLSLQQQQQQQPQRQQQQQWPAAYIASPSWSPACVSSGPLTLAGSSSPMLPVDLAGALTLPASWPPAQYAAAARDLTQGLSGIFQSPQHQHQLLPAGCDKQMSPASAAYNITACADMHSLGSTSVFGALSGASALPGPTQSASKLNLTWQQQQAAMQQAILMLNQVQLSRELCAASMQYPAQSLSRAVAGCGNNTKMQIDSRTISDLSANSLALLVSQGCPLMPDGASSGDSSSASLLSHIAAGQDVQAASLDASELMQLASLDDAAGRGLAAHHCLQPLMTVKQQSDLSWSRQ